MYIFIKIKNYENLYNKKILTKDINKDILDTFNGEILIVEDKLLFNNIKFFTKIYKNMKLKSKNILIITYLQVIEKSDIECFEKLKIKFLPCIVHINSEVKEKFYSYKVDEYK